MASMIRSVKDRVRWYQEANWQKCRRQQLARLRNAIENSKGEERKDLTKRKERLERAMMMTKAKIRENIEKRRARINRKPESGWTQNNQLEKMKPEPFRDDREWYE